MNLKTFGVKDTRQEKIYSMIPFISILRTCDRNQNVVICGGKEESIGKGHKG